MKEPKLDLKNKTRIQLFNKMTNYIKENYNQLIQTKIN